MTPCNVVLVRRALCGVAIMGTLVMGATACNDLSGIAGSQQLPSGTPNPNSFNTPAGALALYQATLATFQYTNGVSTASTGGASTTINHGAFVDYVLQSGVFTDELHAGDWGCTGVGCSVSQTDQVDARQFVLGATSQSYPTDLVYSELQAVRGGAGQAIGALAAYDDSAPPALRGWMYTLSGYADVLLADLFCSGVPLSTIDFHRDYTYHVSSTTAGVDSDAVFKFDTALTLAGDSATLLNLTRVGKGRAWLALGAYDSAAAAVAAVPDAFTYQFTVDWTGGLTTGQNLFTTTGIGATTVSDSEGRNGLPYISSGDVRTASESASVNVYGLPLYVPVQYGGATPGLAPITVANGVEARLIQAEAALRAQQYGSWLTYLNRARALAAPTLAPLSDPGASPNASSNDSARVALLFRERAFDLFLTGHRQGDLRRLVRQYHWTISQTYPIGAYPVIQIGDYSSEVTVPIPPAESSNPLFHGCLSRGA